MLRFVVDQTQIGYASCSWAEVCPALAGATGPSRRAAVLPCTSAPATVKCASRGEWSAGTHSQYLRHAWRLGISHLQALAFNPWPRLPCVCCIRTCVGLTSCLAKDHTASASCLGVRCGSTSCTSCALGGEPSGSWGGGGLGTGVNTEGKIVRGAGR